MNTAAFASCGSKDTQIPSSLFDSGITASLIGDCNDYILNNQETQVDCGGPNCAACTLDSKSCKALLTKDPDTPNGVYSIDPDASGPTPSYLAYCEMIADGGGWTLAIKADGAQSTFSYHNDNWTTAALLNSNAPDLDTTEAKLDSFNRIPAKELRLGFNLNSATRWIVLPLTFAPARTLHFIFSQGYRSHTSLGRAAWLGAIDGASLQAYCNEEGTNLLTRTGATVSVRIGIVANEQNDCNSNDSYIGIGGNMPMGCADGSPFMFIAGNSARCNDPDGDRNISTFSYVMVRE